MVIKDKLVLEAMDDKEEEFKSLMKPYFDEMTKHLMQGFELFSSQLGGKPAPRSSNSSPHDDRKTHGEAIFSKTEPHNQPHELKNKNVPKIPKCLESK